MRAGLSMAFKLLVLGIVVPGLAIHVAAQNVACWIRVDEVSEQVGVRSPADGSARPEERDSDSQRIVRSAESGATEAAVERPADDGFRWKPALTQSVFFLGIQHAVRMSEAKTRCEFAGPFFADYVRSVSNLNGWGDGGKDFTNYVGHPMMGAVAGFIQIHNDPRGAKQTIGTSKGYVTSRLKAFAWSAAYSAQFEIGPLSEASLGNVGRNGRAMGYVDLVVTPALGTAWVVAEDALDEGLVRRLEGKHVAGRIIARIALNPMRSFANVLRLKVPWHRDSR